MLLPDNIQPENSIYYNGALILDVMQIESNISLMELYQQVERKMTFPLFILCLDWLYLIEMAEVDEKGIVRLCS